MGTTTNHHIAPIAITWVLWCWLALTLYRFLNEMGLGWCLENRCILP